MSSSPAVANGIVYIGNFDGNLYAINAATGTLVWNYTMNNYPGDPGVYSSPAVANGIVYVGNANRNLYALNAETGDLIWNYTTGNRYIPARQSQTVSSTSGAVIKTSMPSMQKPGLFSGITRPADR